MKDIRQNATHQQADDNTLNLMRSRIRVIFQFHDCV